MNSLGHIHLNINLVYVTLFSMLGLFTTFMHIPNDSEFSGYRKSRLTLGGAFFFMAIYCVVRAFMPSHQNDYMNFWLLTTVSLIFVWLNYCSFLFLIDTSYSIRKTFTIDGIIPVSAMFIVGVCGQFLTSYQAILEYVLGAIFLAKCIRMLYVCEREWRKVNQEQQDFYDEGENILWMRVLVWLTFFLSICTLAALYIPSIHILYDYTAPLVFIYTTIKIVNYLPKKIDDMRIREDNETDDSSTAKKTPKKKELHEKIGAGVERWVANKCYCTPNLSIKEVAAQIGTNHNYLSQYINNTLETTFQLWLNTLRIEESKHILISENITIEEVGGRVGIPQSYNFSRWFKTITGTTPFKFRKEEGRNRHSVST